MTPKQRVFERIAGRDVDKIPNMCMASFFSAEYSKIDYKTFCCDYRALVEAQSRIAEDFGIDVLSTRSDCFRETSDYGAEISFFNDIVPVCSTPIIKSLFDWHKLRRWNPYESSRSLDSLYAIQLFKKIFKNDYPILGWVEGPLSQFCNLATLNIGMSLLNSNKTEIKYLFEFLTDQAIECIKAQIKCGADIIGINEPNASLLGVESYKNILLKEEAKLVNAIHDNGAISKFHVTGNNDHILPLLIQANSDIIDIDHLVNLDNAVELNKLNCSLCGNIDSAGIILRGNKREIKSWVDHCIQHGDKKLIISSGSEINFQTPTSNLIAINERLIELSLIHEKR